MKKTADSISSLSYDEAVARIEEIVTSLEQAQALSVSEYKQKATQAQQLLDYCDTLLKGMAKEFGA